MSNSGSGGQHKALRIGILVDRGFVLHDWQQRLCQKVIDSDHFKVVALIINDAGAWPAPKQSLLARGLQQLCQRFDERALSATENGESDRLGDSFAAVQRVSISPTRGSLGDTVNAADCAELARLDLDVLIDHSNSLLRGPVLDVPRFGIWWLYAGDNASIRGEMPAFWASALGEASTGATLLRLTDQAYEGPVIGQCWLSTESNARRNHWLIHDLSVSLIWRELNRLQRSNKLTTKQSPAYSKPIRKAPGVMPLLRYVGRRVGNTLSGARAILLSRLRRPPDRVWTLAIGRQPVSESSMGQATILPQPDEVFRADPFVVTRDGKTYVLFEEFDYAVGRGHIAAGVLHSNDTMEYLGRVLETPYHLSFPFVFEHDGDTFMIPEAEESNRLEVWRATEFPMKWELFSTAFEGQGVADTCVFEYEGQWWLTTNLSQTVRKDYCNELHVFMVDGPALRSITPHPNNPVVIDSRCARNGGRPFVRDGKLIRPAQNNSYGVYGYGFKLMEVTCLTDTEYEEKTLLSVDPSVRAGMVGLHHFDGLDDIFIFDYCRGSRVLG